MLKIKSFKVAQEKAAALKRPTRVLACVSASSASLLCRASQHTQLWPGRNASSLCPKMVNKRENPPPKWQVAASRTAPPRPSISASAAAFFSPFFQALSLSPTLPLLPKICTQNTSHNTGHLQTPNLRAATVLTMYNQIFRRVGVPAFLSNG